MLIVLTEVHIIVQYASCHVKKLRIVYIPQAKGSIYKTERDLRALIPGIEQMASVTLACTSPHKIGIVL